MTEHLPECPVIALLIKGNTVAAGSCICDRLRACEERVTRAVMHTVDVDSYEEGQRVCTATHPVLALKEITRIASKGYDAGLDAAREAVKAVNWFNDEGKMLSAIVATADALAAIDALKEKQPSP